MGYSSEIIHTIKESENDISSPSHLEAVNAVASGICKKKIDKEYDGNFNKVFPVIIHGDEQFQDKE